MTQPTHLRELHALIHQLTTEAERMMAQAAPVELHDVGPAVVARCPHCHVTPSEWVELDFDARLNSGWADAGTGGERPCLGIAQGDSNYATLAYACGECEQLVAMPVDRIEVVW